MLVEDDDAVRSLTAIVLENAGYTVLPAATGEEALAICAQLAKSPELVITDVVMPGMNGRELVQQLSKHYPKLKVALLSGYTPETVETSDVDERHMAYLQKPYTPDSLCRFVYEVLNEAETG